MKNIIVFGEYNELTKPLINATKKLGCVPALAIFANAKEAVSSTPFRYQINREEITDWSNVIMCVGTNAPSQEIPAVAADKDSFMRKIVQAGFVPDGERVTLPIPANIAGGTYKPGNFRWHEGGWWVIGTVTDTETICVKIPLSFWDKSPEEA